MAMQAGVPIVPVVIRNAHDAMPKGTNVFREAAIEVIALSPISTENWKKEHLNDYIEEVRGLFLQELGQEQPVDRTHENGQPGASAMHQEP